MSTEDMSIFWNQSKGQYETGNSSVYPDNLSYTRTADQRLKFNQTITYSESDAEENTSTSDIVKIESWIGTFILLLLPGINVISLIAIAIGSKSNTKKTFARALLFFLLIIFTLALVFMVLTCDKIEYKDIFDKFLSLGSKIFGTMSRLF